MWKIKEVTNTFGSGETQTLFYAFWQNPFWSRDVYLDYSLDLVEKHKAKNFESLEEVQKAIEKREKLEKEVYYNKIIKKKSKVIKYEN